MTLSWDNGWPGASGTSPPRKWIRGLTVYLVILTILQDTMRPSGNTLLSLIYIPPWLLPWSSLETTDARFSFAITTRHWFVILMSDNVTGIISYHGNIVDNQLLTRWTPHENQGFCYRSICDLLFRRMKDPL